VAPREALLTYLEWCRQRGLKHPVVAVPPAGTAAAVADETGLETEAPPLGLVTAPVIDRLASQERGATRVLFLGDAPTTEALAAQMPFAGDERSLLEKMIAAMKLGPLGACLANAFPSATGAAPSPQELADCAPLVAQVVAVTSPELVIALGAHAAAAAFGAGAPFAELRGRILSSPTFGGIPTIVTQHPRELLARPEDKRAAWSDLQRAMQWLAQRADHETRRA
jgi:DNA polymerase